MNHFFGHPNNLPPIPPLLQGFMDQFNPRPMDQVMRLPLFIPRNIGVAHRHLPFHPHLHPGSFIRPSGPPPVAPNFGSAAALAAVASLPPLPRMPRAPVPSQDEDGLQPEIEVRIRTTNDSGSSPVKASSLHASLISPESSLSRQTRTASSSAHQPAILARHRLPIARRPSKTDYECDVCSEIYYLKEDLDRHKKTAHRKKKTTQQRSQQRNDQPSSSHGPTFPVSRGHYFSVNDPSQVEFFSSVSQRIAENLLLHVDGRTPSPTSPNVVTAHLSPNFIYPDRKIQDDKNQEDIRLTATGDHSDDLQSIQCIKKKGPSDFVCTICGKRCSDRMSFLDHSKNNHPNVSSSSYVLATSDVPSHLLSASHFNSTSTVHKPSSSVKADTNDSPISCTKCEATFESMDLLREHIFDCAKKSKNLKKFDKQKEVVSPSDDPNSYTTRSGKRRVQISPTPPETQQSLPLPAKRKKGKMSRKTAKKSRTLPTKTIVAQVKSGEEEPSATVKTEENTQPEVVEVNEIMASTTNDDEATDTEVPPTEEEEEMAQREDRVDVDPVKQVANPVVWAIKQDDPQYAYKGSPAQHHTCPYCQRGFTYLANYRKHVKGLCPVKLEGGDARKEGQNEDGLSGSSLPVKKLKTFPCIACHRVFVSFVELMKHRLSHRMAGDAATMESVETEAATQPTTTSLCPEEVPSRRSSTEEDEVDLEERLARTALLQEVTARTEAAKERRPRRTSTHKKVETEVTVIPSTISSADLLESLAQGGETVQVVEVEVDNELVNEDILELTEEDIIS